jgi:hypothetical protein
MLRPLHPVTLIAAIAGLISPGIGQIEVLRHPLDSGLQHNSGEATGTVWSEVVSLPAASSVQLHFEDVLLRGEDDAVVVSSVQDGAVQVLRPAALKRWQNHTAWFNGPAVLVGLNLAPGSQGRVRVEALFADVTPGAPESIGGSDGRALSVDPTVYRVLTSATLNCGLPGPCATSAFLISNTSTILTEGNVAANIAFTIAEFNVPVSQFSGAIVHPAPADQYPIDRYSGEWSGTTMAGNNWAVARLHPNAAGETAYARQGLSFTLATSRPATGTLLRVTGFGIDSTPDPSRNHACQTATGPLIPAPSGTIIYHQVDTDAGSSGSPILIESTVQVIGIHTHDGCGPSSGSNSGTSILNPFLQASIAFVSGCASVSLSDGVSQVLTCPNTIYNCTPDTTKWNAVGVSSPSDWDVILGTGQSHFVGNACDFVLANGHFGSFPASLQFIRNSGTSAPTAEFRGATSIAIGSPAATTLTAGGIIRPIEFNVASAGNYDITVAGSTPLS